VGLKDGWTSLNLRTVPRLQQQDHRKTRRSITKRISSETSVLTSVQSDVTFMLG